MGKQRKDPEKPTFLCRIFFVTLPLPYDGWGLKMNRFGVQAKIFFEGNQINLPELYLSPDEEMCKKVRNAFLKGFGQGEAEYLIQEDPLLDNLHFKKSSLLQWFFSYLKQLRNLEEFFAFWIKFAHRNLKENILCFCPVYILEILIRTFGFEAGLLRKIEEAYGRGEYEERFSLSGLRNGEMICVEFNGYPNGSWIRISNLEINLRN